MPVILLGCQSTPSTGLRVEVLFDPALQLDQLRVTVALQGSALQGSAPQTLGPELVPQSPEPLQPGVRVLLLLPRDWDGGKAHVTVEGLEAGTMLVTGQAIKQIEADKVLDLQVTLEGSCESECSAGETVCHDNQIRQCIRSTGGCHRFGPPMDCPPTHPYCSLGACATTCQDECPQSGLRRCKGDGFQQCVETTAGCMAWGSEQACGPDEICRAQDGQCVLDCSGEPCACQPGETLPCADVGQCQGGVRSCESGQFGPCDWITGPSPESCDGKDNDCSGTTDDKLVAPACSKQQGVCQGAAKTCGGTAGWQDCTPGDYAALAQQSGLTFESTEAACDGKDNDCDGAVDEPTSCCQPQCDGKACGADDGCGHPCPDGSCSKPNEICQAGSCVCQPDCAGKACGADDGCGGSCPGGSCPDNASCAAGSCTCDFITCDGACCAAGQTCYQNACCDPQCSGKQCGPDGCGGSCGQCTGGETCSTTGQCETCQPDCTGRQCGPDPVCNTSCGGCTTGQTCDADGQCVGTPTATWTKIAAPVSPTGELWGVSCVPPSTVWITGPAGTFRFDGSLWDSYTSVGGMDIWASAPDDAWIASYTSLKHFTGSSWSSQSTPSSRSVQAIHGCSANSIWAVGSGGSRLYYSGSWYDAGYAGVGYLYDVWCSGTNKYWAVGGTTLTEHNVVSNVSGYTLDEPGEYLYAVWGQSGVGAWAVGGGGLIMQNIGSGWQAMGSPTTVGLSGIWGSSDSDIWAVGNGGAIVHYDGSSWSSVTSPTNESLFNIHGCSASDIWAVGKNGTVLRFH